MYIESNLTRVLDKKLEEGRNNKEILPPICIVTGLSGFGATSIVRSWLKHNELDYCEIQSPSLKVKELEVEQKDWSSLLDSDQHVHSLEPPVVKKTINVIFNEEEIDEMNKPGKVIFIDDYDWADYPVRQELMKLIRRSIVTDSRLESSDFKKRLKNILLLIIRVHSVRTFGDPYDNIEKQIFGEQEILK